MIKLIGAVVGAFFLFMVGFPLIGLLATLVLKVCLPYLLVPAIAAVLVQDPLHWGTAMGAVLFSGMAWASLVLTARRAIRSREPALAWHQGHYRAALRVLSLGLPSWSGKAASEETAEEIPSGAEIV